MLFASNCFQFHFVIVSLLLSVDYTYSLCVYRYMNVSSTSSDQIVLRSGRVLSEDTRRRPSGRGRGRGRPRRTESAPPVTHLPEQPTPPKETMGDVNNNDQVPPIDEVELPLSHYSNPSVVNAPSCIVHPHPQIAYEIKHSILSILPTFHGVEKERPYDHMVDFDAICSTYPK